MLDVFVFLLGVVVSIEALSLCPIPDYPLCANDGFTFKNICELQLAKVLNPSLDLVHIGPCKEASYELYRALLQGNRNKDLLRSRHRKNRKNKRLSSSSSGPGDDDYDESDYLQRLSDLQFKFRRDQEGQEPDEEE